MTLIAQPAPATSTATQPIGTHSEEPTNGVRTVGPELLRMFTATLGVWPSPGTLRVVPSARRVTPGWDTRIRPLLGIRADHRYGHASVLSVPPLQFPDVRSLVDSLDARRHREQLPALLAALPATLGLPEQDVTSAVLRWSTQPAPMPDLGTWTSANDPSLPPWLAAFPESVLIARGPAGRYLAGVGIKRHNHFAHEIAVGTDPAARGRGLARALVAQAARRILSDGAVPLYLHDPANAASARVADAAGFPDRGWQWLSLTDR